MLDLKTVRERPEWVEARLKTRSGHYDLTTFYALEAEKRELQAKTEKLQARRNEISRAVGRMKANKEDAAELLTEMATLGPLLKETEGALRTKEEDLQSELARLPNLPAEEVPIGPNESGNVVLRSWPEGFKQTTPATWTPLNHWDVGERLGILDFASAAETVGARFTFFRGAGARLIRALTAFMLDLHTLEHGYEEILPPFLTNKESLFGTGQLPKFEEDLFCLRDEPFYLIPTAEVPLTNMVRGQIIDESRLPIKLTAWTACFRREAGAAGRDTRGLIRQHQFDKVELVWITRPEESMEALESLTSHAETVLKRLELPYRTVALCTGDMGFASAKTYDLEVWLPGQGCYREISSCSNTLDFQARRMKARLRRTETKVVEPVHTLNGSGVAVGRALVAVLENYQQADGSVVIPDALRPYLGGISLLKPTM
ncbi:MAG: serine--tRNA ligase [Magnetococcales bacterium]|nr:serine--tRNA ligase [Magnetococcales bacterium]MBF0439808.1 serine--tRNA ligase [Magnetococcales bacterium]